MNNNTNTTSNQLDPVSSVAAHSQNSDMSPLTAILSLLVLIAIPAFIYAFFFAINCPRIPRLGRLARSSSGSTDELSSKVGGGGHLELVSGVRYSKETHGEENGNECPVCLSGFIEGDYVKQLNSCKHSFHVVCIDKWLYSHSSCPVCRASVPVKRTVVPKRPSLQRDEDLRQGLPDAASLV